jgi:hypothetical protein
VEEEEAMIAAKNRKKKKKFTTQRMGEKREIGERFFLNSSFLSLENPK